MIYVIKERTRLRKNITLSESEIERGVQVSGYFHAKKRRNHSFLLNPMTLLDGTTTNIDIVALHNRVRTKDLNRNNKVDQILYFFF